jgi:CoA:oxalate CoA-transferase
LKALNPRLIMLSISGVGPNNPDIRRAAYAPIVHSETGLVARQAEITGAFPAELPLSVADTNASMHGLIGLLAALYEREQSGKGDHLEIAMVDATIVTNDNLHAALEDVTLTIMNEVHETAAGHLMLAGDFKFMWHQLSTIHGVEDGLSGPASLEEKIKARRAAAKHFFTETCRGREEVIAALDKMNVAWGDVRPTSDVRELASVKARESIANVDDRAGGMRSIPQSPYRFQRNESRVRGGAPHLGEHNEEVLKDWLDWSTEDIARVADALVSKDE